MSGLGAAFREMETEMAWVRREKRGTCSRWVGRLATGALALFATCPSWAATAAGAGTGELGQKVLAELAAGREAGALARQAAAERRQAGIKTSTVLPPSSEVAGELAQAMGDLRLALSGAASPSAVAAAYDRFEAQDLLLRRELEQTAERLAELAIGGEVESRFQSTRELYLEISDRLHAALAPVSEAVRQQRLGGEPSSEEEAAARLAAGLSDALGVLEAIPAVEAPSVVLRAANLPFRRASLTARAPQLTPTVTPSYLDPVAAAPGADELSGDLQAPLSEPILVKAAELGHDAVAIYEFVRNQITTEHYAGAMKGAEGTLAQGSGNDVDQASLLVALLRASTVPARYVRGVLELPVERLAAELGLADPAQVPAVLGRAGLAFRPVIRGGRVAALEIEHTWVSAYVPYTNYRGAVVDFSGRIWVPLAPALKTYQLTPATAVLREMAYPVAAKLEAYLAAAQSRGLMAEIRAEVEGYLQTAGNGESYAEQLGSKVVNTENLKLLPSSMPAIVVAVVAEEAQLSASQIHRVRFIARQGAAEGSPVAMELETTLAEVAGHRVTLSYTPATVEDHRAVNAWGGLYAVPLYLVQLRPQIKIDGQPVVVGAGQLDMGAPHRFEVELTGPTGTQRIGQTVLTGAYHALAIGAQGTLRPTETEDDPADSERQAARLLSQLAHGYSATWDAAEAELGGLLDVAVLRPLPSIAIASNAVAVRSVLGLPFAFEWKGVTLDAALRAAEPVARRADAAAAADWMRLAALEGSAQEQLVFREQFQVDAISADKGLGLARSAGFEIVRLTSTNIATELPNLNHPAVVKAEVENWARQGLVVEIPRGPLSRNIWSGSVWRVEEPATGAAGYFISGQLAGGSSTEAPAQWVLDFLTRALAAPYSAEPNPNPLAVARLIKIPAGDGQEGEVGQPYPQELAVLARDRDGRPVVGAQVTFTVSEGGGKVGGGASTTVATDELGIAKVVLEAGQDTNASPVYLLRNAGDEWATQALAHIVDATAPGLGGGTTSILTPFEATAYPGPPASLVPTSTEDSLGTQGLWVDTLRAAVRDQFGNPISNINVSFSVGSPQINCSPPPAGFQNAVVFDFATCQVPVPQLGDCGSANVSDKTSIRGAAAGVIMGSGVSTLYNVTVSAPGVGSFNRQYQDPRGCQSGPSFSYTTSYSSDEAGGNVQAVKAGQAYTRRPVPVKVMYEWPDYEIKVNSSGRCFIEYKPGREWRITTANISIDVSNGGSAGGASRVGDTYLSVITTGLTPAENTLSLEASDLAYDYAYVDPDTCAEEVRTGQGFLAGSLPSVFGLNPTVSALAPEVLQLNVLGQSTEPVKITYTSPPPSYRALTMEANLYEDGQLIGRAVSSSRGDTGDMNVQRGMVFDIDKTYEAEIIANRGGINEVKGDRFEIPLRQPIFFGVQSSFGISQDVDVLNQRVCAIGSEFSFSTTQEANVTLTLRKIESSNTDGTENLGSEIKLIDGQDYPAGDHSISVSPTDLLPGDYRFLLSGVSALDGHEDFAPSSGPGFATSQFRTQDNLPVGHAMYRSVDLFDGHLALMREDLAVPGRGRALNLLRSYSSSGLKEIGPMGIGWSHSYDSKVFQNACGEMVIAGADGGGGRFVPGTDGFVPLKGYHGTLVRDGATSGWKFSAKDGTRYTFGPVPNNVREWILELVEDTNGNKTTLVYDRSGDKPKLISVTDPAGRTFAFFYERRVFNPGTGDVIVKVTGPAGLEISYEYDSQANLVAAHRESSARSEKYIYSNTADAPYETRNQLVEVQDLISGANTSYTFEKIRIGVDGVVTVPTWAVTGITEPGGSSTIDYDGAALEGRDAQYTVTVSGRVGEGAVYTLNKYGSPLSVVDGNGLTELTSWSPDDVVMLSRTDKAGFTTTMTYDQDGNLLTEVADIGSATLTTTNTYTGPIGDRPIKNRLASNVNRRGVVTQFTYDGRGNVLSKSISSAGYSERYTYDGRGDRRTHVDANGKTTSLSYDAAGNITSVVDPLGGASTSVWDERSRLISTTDPEGRTTRYSYDTLNRLIETLYADGTSETTTFDDAGHTRTFVDVAGRTTVSSFDLEGRLTRITDPEGNAKEISYDSGGHKTAESNFFGNGTARADTTYTYDGGGRMIRRTEPMGRVTTFTYDGNGNATTETLSGPGLSAPQVTASTFDGLSRQLTITRNTAAGTSVETKEYDGEGNVTLYRDPLGEETRYTYDGLNRLLTSTDPLGGVTTKTYDPGGNLLSEKDALGNTRRMEYDALNRVTRKIDALNNALIYEYDKVGNIVREIDPRLSETVHTYDNRGRRIRTSRPVTLGLNPVGNVVTSMSYDAVGNLTRVTQPNGNVVTQVYDGNDRLVAKSDSQGPLFTGSYDANGNLLVATDPMGRTSTRTYDALNRLTREEMPEGRVKTYTYDVAGNRLSESDPNGNTTTLDYDASGRLVRTNDPAAVGTFTTVTYDLAGQITEQRDRRGNVTAFTLDALHRVIRVDDPPSLGTFMTYTYDAVGNKTAETDRRGLATSYTYDKENRLLTASRAGVTVRTLQYDKNGNVRFDTDANGNIVGFEYDERNLKVSENRPLAAITRFGLDAMGDPVEQRDPENHTRRYTYDLRRRLLTEVNGATDTTTYTYDGSGNRLSMTRPTGGTWLYEYDNADRLTSVADPLSQATTYEYDANGNRTAIFDALAQFNRFEYDALNRQTATEAADGSRSEMTLDGNGNIVASTDPKGQTATFDYDALNRQTAATFGAAIPPTGDDLGTRTSTYDANGNLLAVEEVYSGGTGTRTTTYTYDDFDRQLSMTDPQGEVVRYGYDANGNRIRLQDPDNRVTTYAFDALNRLVSVTVQSSGVTQYEYFRNSLLKRVLYPNLSESRYTYDAANRMTLADNRQGPASVSSFTYTYDRNSNRTQQIEVNGGASETTDYHFDTADRLTGVDYPDKITVYTYDAVGNRLSEVDRDLGGTLLLSKTFSYDNRNRVTRVTNLVDGSASVDYTYDANGNQTSRTQTGVVTDFLYDSRDQLVELDRGGSLVGRYLYDHQGLRVRKTGSGQDLRYVYDDTSVLLQTDAAGNSIAKYDYGPDRLLSLLHVSEGRQFYLFDGLGSISNLTKPDGTVQARYQYDAWGNPRNTVGASFNPFGFTGHERDAESGLYYFKARFYDPELGRFLNEDPAEGDPNNPPSLHKYLYAHANPTIYIDPDGRASTGTMIDEAAVDALSKGEKLKFAGWFALSVGYKFADVLTVGFIGKHDAARDAYDAGKISESQYWSETGKAAGKSAVILAAGVATGGAGVAVSGALRLGAGSTAVLAGAAGGVGTQLATDGVEGRISSAKDLAVAAALGGAAGGAFHGFERLKSSSIGQKSLTELAESVMPKARNTVTAEAASGGTTAGAAQGTRSLPAVSTSTEAEVVRSAARAETPAATQELVVIGRRADTAVAKEWQNHRVLDIPDWTIAKNDAWVKQAIDERATVYLASPPTKANLFDDVAGRQTVFGRERDQFLKAGYREDGVHLRPPGTSPATSSAGGAKRGPKPKGEGPHNLTIDRRIRELKEQNMEHVAGGSMKEEFIRTPGGVKAARRPDITMRRPDGTLYRENVGRRAADGQPIKREVDALDDLERQLGERPGFTPYD